MPAFTNFTDADFDRLDAELLTEVINLCVQYNASRSFAASMEVSKAGGAALERAKLLVGFMTMPNEFRRYYESAEQAGSSDLLTAANGFRPHNDACSARLRADLERLLMPAVLAERARRSARRRFDARAERIEDPALRASVRALARSVQR